ncbi:MAG: hypothetical protein ACRD2U_04670 [Terriglobales bacterium]
MIKPINISKKLAKAKKRSGRVAVSHANAATPNPADANPTSLLSFVPSSKENFSFLLGEDFVEKHNVAWRVELASDDAANPLMEPLFPWESAAVFSHGTVLLDPIDGLWKAWYISAKQTKLQSSAERRLCYAESKDGLRWTRPKLDICAYPGFPRTNILLDIKSGGSSQHASVIVHPDAPSDYRYEMFVIRLPGWEHPYTVVKGFKLPTNSASHGGKQGDFKPGYFRYHSKDGKNWIPWEVVSLETSDSGWICQQPDGSYVAYHKAVIPALPGAMVPYDIAAGVCRILVRRTSPDGRTWSQSEPVVTPDWMDPQDTQFMELTPLSQRGGSVGLVTVYHVLNQSIDVQFTGSRDGKNWWRPDRRACIPLKALGDLGGGMIWPMHPMIQHNGRIYLYYSGCEGLHNDYHSTDPVERMKAARFPRWPHYWEPLTLGKDVFSPVRGVLWFYGSLCRASWQAGRLWALVTATGGGAEGTALTRDIDVKGKRLTVNVATIKEGSLTAELVKDGKPLRGFTRADCKPVRGDHNAAPLLWKGGSTSPSNCQIRFYLQRARLYGFDF